jgi:cysteinyl-tRNA synthetase
MTEIFLYNTLSGKKEKFEPILAGKVSMYNCGPTVYNYAHIGNFRTFIMGDVLRRMFEYNKYDVKEVMNITDVDDKTIRKSQEEKTGLETVTRRYEKLFFDDLKALNILIPTKTPRATESVPEMISLIQKLLDKGVAYASSDGIYFDIGKSKNYGALAHLDLQSIGKERISNDEYDKENARDFALWKFYTPEDGDVFYEAPFGKGRPGWHIECSAMSISNLGETIDVHTGGSDLIFPHHTNEIAQSEAATGKPFVHYWVHGGFITVDGKKMSKSLGNIFRLSDIVEKGFDPLAYRYFVLGAHYRTLLNFTWEALEGAQTALKRLREAIKSDSPTGSENKGGADLKMENHKNDFKKFVSDDLDFPKALALVWEIVKDAGISGTDKKDLILDFDKVLGLELDKVETFEIPAEVAELVTARDTARAEKNWKLSDELRQKIESLGFEVKDAPGGTKISKK